jgi:hypothetical protein
VCIARKYTHDGMERLAPGCMNVGASRIRKHSGVLGAALCAAAAAVTIRCHRAGGFELALAPLCADAPALLTSDRVG